MAEQRKRSAFEATPPVAVVSAPAGDRERFLNVRMPERILDAFKVYAVTTKQSQKDIVQQLVVDLLRSHGYEV